MSRFINEIFTLNTGTFYSNAELLPLFQEAVENLKIGIEDKEELHKSIKYFLMGERSRRCVDGWLSLDSFQKKARAFEKNVENALDSLAAQISQVITTANFTFDAVLTTTSTGNLMPGISYKLAHRLPNLIRPDSLMLDLGNVGCTGGVKALNLANSLDKKFNNILICSIELPSAGFNLQATTIDGWQANCTFGDGAVALWVSSDPQQGVLALELEQINYIQKAHQGLDLISWEYQNYYTFKLRDQNTFERDVQSYILEVLQQTQSAWQTSTFWAIHPAGIAILLKLSRKLKLSRESITPSITSYGKYSNMSSASIFYILKDLAQDLTVGQHINLLTMGAGFNVIYGCLAKVR